MTSSPAVTSLFSPTDTLASLGHQARTPSYDWKQARDSKSDGLDTTELSRSQDRTPPKDSAANNSARRTPSNMQKSAYNPTPLVMTQQMTIESMKSNPKSAAPREPFIVDGSPDGNTANGVHRRVSNRWSYTGAEQSLGNWQQFAEEFGKLNVGDDANDNTDDVTTPSNTHSKDSLTNDASPLETSSSESSLESNANPDGDALLISSHSRGSSTDTSASEVSSRSQMLSSTLKASSFNSDPAKDRPRSFSGAISDVELKRLQNIHTPGQYPEKMQDRSSPLRNDPYNADGKTLSSTPSSENVHGAAQPLFPSLTTYPNGNYSASIPPGASQAMLHGHGAPRNDDLQVDGNMQPRSYPNTTLGAPFTHNPPVGPMRVQTDVSQFRQPPPRPMNVFQPAMPLPAQGPPSLLSSPNNFPYAALPNVHGHHNHMSLGNTQQVYDLMLAPVDPAINRAQQSFRGHQHSASDPASLRDAAALLLNNGIPVPGMTFAGAGVYPPMSVATPPIFPNQFFPGASPQAQAAYTSDILGRTIPQYGVNGNAPAPQAGSYPNVSTSPSNSSGPSANNRKLGLYKTELCRSWEEKGSCRYGPKCQFAHGEEEIRKVARHPKYKTEICRTFWVSGSCPYGKRCCFIHTELPASGTPGAPPAAAEGAASPSTTDGRARSMSTNSDPNDAPVSLLARISAKRNQDTGPQSAVTPTASTPIDASSYHQFNTSRPGALRVDTKVVDSISAASKQNKSAYPSFASNTIAALSPGPVTAGPDLGRHINLNMLDVNQRLNTAGPQTPTNPTRPVGANASPFGVLSSETPSSGNPSGHGHGHSRSGSASNWGSFSQKSQFGGTSSYAHTPSPANDLANSASGASGWGEMNAGASRWL